MRIFLEHDAMCAFVAVVFSYFDHDGVIALRKQQTFFLECFKKLHLLAPCICYVHTIRYEIRSGKPLFGLFVRKIISYFSYFICWKAVGLIS